MANTKDDNKATTNGVTKANATDAKTQKGTTSVANETTSEAARLKAAKNACNAARQRIYQDVNKYPEFKLLYLKGTKGKMPCLLEPETPFADERMVKAYAKLKRDFDSLIAARNAQDEIRNAMAKETETGKPKVKKPTSDTKTPASQAKQTCAKADAADDANGAVTPQKPSKEHAGKTAGDGNATSVGVKANGMKRKEAHAGAQKTGDKAESGKPKDTVKRGATPEDDTQRQKNPRIHETAAIAPDDAKTSDGKQTTQRDASGDGTTGTLTLAKDTAAKAIAKADASVTHAIKKVTEAKEGERHGMRQGGGDKATKQVITANGHDEKDTPHNDEKDGKDAKPVTEGNTQMPADGNRQKAKPSTGGTQKDKASAANKGQKAKASVTSKTQKPKAPADDKTQKPSAGKAQKTVDVPKPAESDKGSASTTSSRKATPGSRKAASTPEHKKQATKATKRSDSRGSNTDEKRQNGSTAAASHESEQPSRDAKPVRAHGRNAGNGKKATKGESVVDASPKGMSETQNTMVADDHNMAGNDGNKVSKDTVKASRSHAVAQRADKVDSPDDNNHDDAAKPSPASHADQPSASVATADDKMTTHAASDDAGGKHAESAKATEGDVVAHDDGRQDTNVQDGDDATSTTPHATPDMPSVPSGVVPSDVQAKVEEEAADEPLAQTAAEQGDMNDRMSCNDDAQTCSFNKAPDEVIERIGTLEDDAIHGAPVYAHRSKAQWNHEGMPGHVRVRTEIGTESHAANARHAGAETGFLGRIGRAFRNLLKR